MKAVEQLQQMQLEEEDDVRVLGEPVSVYKMQQTPPSLVAYIKAHPMARFAQVLPGWLPVPGYEWISPELAQQWLDKLNTRNRPKRPRHARDLAEIMRSGTWQGLNGTTITFDTHGRLVDGQNRLLACVLSGFTILMLIVRYVPDDSFRSIDEGDKRTLGQTLAMSGLKNTNILAPAARLVEVWRAQNLERLDQTDASPNRMHALANAEHDERLQASATWVANHKGLRKMISAHAVLIHYAGTLTGREKEAVQFLDRVANGYGTHPTDPVHHFIKFLVRNRAQKAKVPTPEALALAIKAWNAVLEDKPVRQLVYRPYEKYPELDGWDIL